MDEGINSFSECQMMDRRYGGQMRLPTGQWLRSHDLGRIQTIAARETDALVTPSWQFASGGAYGRNSYARAATAVDQIRQLLGDEAFWRAFRTYAERWRFDHPSTEDFLDAFRPAGGQKLEPLIRGTWYGNATVDYAVVRATSAEVRPFEGYDDKGKKTIAPKKEKASGEGKGKDGKKARKSYESIVVVSRTGSMPIPVEVLLTFENGATWKTTWDGQRPWLKLTTVYPSRLLKAEADPGRKVVLDADPWNNARRVRDGSGGEKTASAAAKARAYAVHGVQILLSSLWPLL